VSIKKKNADVFLRYLERRASFLLIGLMAILALALPSLSLGEESPRGLDPWRDATYMPELGGLLNKTKHNQYGQKRDLAECIVLRRSRIKDGKAYVAEGGLYYASDTSYDARPLMRDPMLILGEHCYLLRLKNERTVKRNIYVKKGEKALVDPSGYRMWFDYSTDHYMKPYGEFALIAPSGGWPHEWPISTDLPQIEKIEGFTRPGCAGCSDFLGESADIAVGSLGAKEGYCTMITRSEIGDLGLQNALDFGLLEVVEEVDEEVLRSAKEEKERRERAEAFDELMLMMLDALREPKKRAEVREQFVRLYEVDSIPEEEGKRYGTCAGCAGC